MEKVNGRRRFLRGFGLGGVIASGVAAGYVANKVINEPVSPPAPLPESKKDISHLAPVGGTSNSLMIMRDNDPPPPQSNPYNTITFQPSPSENVNQVTLTVGKDNHLWMYTPDGWKRFVVEG